MKSTHKFATLFMVFLTLTAVYSYGDTFKYYYESEQDQPYGYVSGMFRGKWYGGNLITDISNVSIYPNGISRNDLYEDGGLGYYSFQPIKVSQANSSDLAALSLESAGAQISFDGTANDFAFYIDSTFRFSSRTGQVDGQEGTFIRIFDDVPNYTGPYIGYYKSGLPNSSWSVTLFKTPDNGMTIAMLGMVVAGLACVRRRLR